MNEERTMRVRVFPPQVCMPNVTLTTETSLTAAYRFTGHDLTIFVCHVQLRAH